MPFHKQVVGEVAAGGEASQGATRTRPFELRLCQHHRMDAFLFDPSGKVALVTGGSRGLGLEMVRAFAAQGAWAAEAMQTIEEKK